MQSLRSPFYNIKEFLTTLKESPNSTIFVTLFYELFIYIIFKSTIYLCSFIVIFFNNTLLMDKAPVLMYFTLIVTYCNNKKEKN